jgi:hypothetical protein
MAEQDVMYQKWLPLIANDPAYNPNLSLVTGLIWCSTTHALATAALASSAGGDAFCSR